MNRVHEIMKQLVESGDFEAMSSKENIEKVLLEHGCTREEIEDVLSEFDGFPLDDDDLDAVTGGGSISASAIRDIPNFDV